MGRISSLLQVGILFLLLTGSASAGEPEKDEKPLEAKSIYDIEMNDIDGEPVKLKKYEDRVLLLVNVASKCGYTPQYKGLEALHEKYKNQGFSVLGFPANNFGSQEPGSNEEIKLFCTTTYDISFPMFAKISVKGEDTHPLYHYLISEKTNPEFAGEIKWNFNKFLLDRKGKVIGRYDSAVAPDDDAFVKAIENAINEKEAEPKSGD